MKYGCGHQGRDGGSAFVDIAINSGCGSRSASYQKRLCGACTRFLSDLQRACREAEPMTEKLDGREAKVIELNF